MRTLSGFSRWSRAVSCLALLSSLVAACSLLIDHDKNQCDTDADCLNYGGHPSCQAHVCVVTNLGPDGCFFGTPSTPEQFANQCSTAQCEKFDNCTALGMCGDAGVAPAEPPPDASPGGGGGGPIDAPGDPPLPPCVDPTKNTVIVGGSTAVQPFMPVVAKLLAAAPTPYQIAYQPSGSCTGVDNIFNPAKQVVKDIPGKQAVLYNGQTAQNCTFGTGATLDVAMSDVFQSSCNAAYTLDDKIGEYRGPIQPMTFVVSTQAPDDAKVMTAEYGHYVFGRPEDTTAKPYNDPALHFIRNSGSGTQQMISRAINVDAGKWWGLDQGSSGKVASTLEAIAPGSATGAIGILSTDFADAARQQLRVLAFKNTGQLCGYYPDSTPFARDKRNVRDGHYNIWGPIHFYTRISNGQPSDAAGALVTHFVLPRLEDSLLDAITDIGFVPPCAMQVARDAEMGALSAFEPDFQCGCYFENRLAGQPPAGCQACVSSADCPSALPACNKGFCEKK